MNIKVAAFTVSEKSINIGVCGFIGIAHKWYAVFGVRNTYLRNYLAAKDKHFCDTHVLQKVREKNIAVVPSYTQSSKYPKHTSKLKQIEPRLYAQFAPWCKFTPRCKIAPGNIFAPPYEAFICQ